jgi:hypothetical protein
MDETLYGFAGGMTIFDKRSNARIQDQFCFQTTL